MNKTELRVIAKIVLAGVGLYVLLQTFLTIFGTFAVILLDESKRPTISITIIAVSIYIAITLSVIYLLVRGANRLSDKIIENETADNTQISSIAVAFRLVCLVAGVFFIYWSIPNLIFTIYQYFLNMNSADSSRMRRIIVGMSSITDIIKYIILFSLGVYLAYGAPGFVRWQVKRTLKQCSKIEEQQPM